MTDFVAIMDLWPSLAELARDVGVDEHRPRMWKHRGVIPPRHWPAVVNAAEARGFDGVTADRLSRAYAQALPVASTPETCE